MNEILAVIFDMDGVILDSESICDITWEMTLKAIFCNSLLAKLKGFS